MGMYDYSYTKAIELYRKDTDFYALIMAAMLKADTVNRVKLEAAWPEVWRELENLYYGRENK